MKRLMGLVGLLLFIAGYMYETPGFERGLQMILTALVFAVCMGLGTKRSQTFRLALLVIACLSLGYLEHLSKYSINDYFQLIYFILPLGLFLGHQKRAYRPIGLLGLLVLNYKYIYLAMIKWEAFKPQMSISITLMYGLVAAVLWLAMSLENEKGLLSQANETLEAQKTDLLTANQKLSNLMGELEALTIVRERQHMAREIHDTVGHALTALVMKLEMTRHFLSDENAKAQGFQMLEESIDDGRNALRATRQVVETLTKERRSLEELKELIAASNRSQGLKIYLEGENSFKLLETETSQVVYRAVQEAITNANKYSKLPHLNLIFKEQEDKFIADFWCSGDTGQIGAKVSPAANINLSSGETGLVEKEEAVSGGFGLRAMSERVREAGGLFTVNPEAGYHIHIELNIQRGGLQ